MSSSDASPATRDDVSVGASLATQLAAMDPKHVTNLGHILGLNPEQATVDSVCDAIRWRYHSKTREAVVAGASDVVGRVGKLLGRDSEPTQPPPVPTYIDLLAGLARKLEVYKPGLEISTLEKNVTYTVITECLVRMTPEQRAGFFEQAVDVSAVLGDGVVESGLSAPLTTLSMLGIANASGMGLYTAAATALGMVTHAVGITLPFAVYSGLSATIGFLLGPAGWFAAGGWLAWQLTGPDWKVLTQVVVYLITQRNQPMGYASG